MKEGIYVMIKSRSSVTHRDYIFLMTHKDCINWYKKNLCGYIVTANTGNTMFKEPYIHSQV